MKLNGTEHKEQKINFLGKRTDKNLVNELTTESGALFKPKQRAISEAIVRLGMNGSSDNVNFLFSVAENLNYGLKKDSELSNFVNKESFVTNAVKKQNNEWEEQLKNALSSSIAMNKTSESAEFKKKFDGLFGVAKDEKTAKSVVNSPLTTRIQQEKELIGLRNEILNSDVLKTVPESFNDNQQQAFTVDKRKLDKNLDYFIASSEVATGEKIECLKVVKHMASSDYKTNSQLKDYKVKILSEIMVDLITQNPNQAKLTSKEVAQRTHGMCAAISISRKAMPQEHKLAFVSMMAAELDENSDMEVYNVTSKDLGQKVKVQKADIDYAQALKEEYRITDAAVTNWMHVADTYGDGTKHYKQYKAFDGENYGIFRDAHLANDMEGANKPKQYTLRSLIKLKEKGEAIETIISEQKSAVLEKRTVEENFVSTMKKAHDNTKSIINELADVSDDKAREIAKNILSDLYLQEIQKPFISQFTDGEVVERAKSILTTVVDCKDNQKLDGLAKKYLYNLEELSSAKAVKHGHDLRLDMFSTSNIQKIFDYAAYTRVKTEYELDIPEKLNEQTKRFGIENNSSPQEVKAKVLKKMENASLIMKREDLDQIKGKICEKINLERRKTQLGDRKAEKAAERMKIVTPMQAEMLKKVVGNFTQSYREVKKEYKEYVKELSPQLEKVYGEHKYGGSLWVGEEGHSGLDTAQQIRVTEQISGKEHFTERSVSKSMDHVEQGKGASTLSSSVSDKDGAFHAQYIYDVDARLAKNSQEKPEVQRVLFTDNSWGGSEMRKSYKKEIGKSYWNDAEGNLRTDYGRNLSSEFGEKGGFGYKDGFFLDKNYTIGVSEEDMTTGKLVMKRNVAGKEQEVDFPLFTKTILRGNNASVSDYDTFSLQQSLYSAISQKSVKDVNGLVQAIRYGNVNEIACLTKDLKKEIMPKVYSHIEKRGDDLTRAIKEDLTEVVSTYPSSIFKPLKNEKISNSDKFVDELAKNLSAVVDNAKKSGNNEIQKQCQVSNESVKAIEDAILENTTPIYKPHYNQFDTVKEKFQNGYKWFLEKINSQGPDSIDTKEKFDALPDDSKVKLTVKKAALFEQMYNLELGLLAENSKISEAVGAANVDYDITQMNSSDKEKKPKTKGLSLDDIRSISDKIVLAKNSSELDSLKKDFRKLTEDQILLGFDKNLLKTMKKSPSDIKQLKAIPSGEKAIDYIDAKFNPSSDEECMGIYKKILDMPKEEQEELVRGSSDSIVGFKAPDYFEFTQRLRGEETSADDCARSVIVYEGLTKEFELKSPFKEGTSVADRLFISLSNAMAYAEIGQWVKQNKTKMLNDYNAFPALPILSPFTENEIDTDNKDMVNQLKEVIVKINDYKNGKGFEPETLASKIDEEIQHEKTILRERVKIIANSCVQPRYADEVIGKINEYASEMGRNQDSPKAKAKEEELIALMSKRHITKSPQELFKSFIKDVTEENSYGSDDARNNITQLKSVFIAKICNAADKSKLEFDLITAARDGKINSVARNLKDSRFGIAKLGKNEALPWNSTQGIGLLVAQLKDEKNNNSTLKHFLLSTGMVSDAVNGLTQGPSPAKHLLRVEDIKNILDKSLAEQNEVLSNSRTWEESNGMTDSQKKSVNIDEVKEIVNKYLEDIKPKSVSEKASGYDDYKTLAQERLEMNDYSGVRVTPLEFINGINQEFLALQESAKEDTIEKIIIHQNTLGEKISTLVVISSMLESSDEKKVVADDYIKRATDSVGEMEKIKETFQKDILDKIDQQAKIAKAESERKKHTVDALDAPLENKKSTIATDEQKQKDQAETMFVSLLQAQKANSELDIKNALYQILNAENPQVTKLLIKNLNDQSCDPLSRAYSVRCLIEKKEFEPIKEYLAPRLATGDDSRLDDAAVNCVDGTIVASILKTGDEQKEYLDLISKAFEIACNKDCQSDNAFALMGQLRNSLSNKSSQINNILLGYAFDKNSDENTRAVSMDILSRSGSGEFRPLMEDVVLNTQKYANNSSEAFTFFDACLLGLKNIRLANPEIKIENKDGIKNIDIKKVIENGMKDAPIEAKAAKEEDFKQRIEYVLSDNPLEKYNEDHSSDEETMISKNPIANINKMDEAVNYIKYSSHYLAR